MPTSILLSWSSNPGLSFLLPTCCHSAVIPAQQKGGAAASNTCLASPGGGGRWMGPIQELTETIGGLEERGGDQLPPGDQRAGAGGGPSLESRMEPHCFTARPILATVCSINLCFENGREGLWLAPKYSGNVGGIPPDWAESNHRSTDSGRDGGEEGMALLNFPSHRG